MSLTKNAKLILVAKQACRELSKRSTSAEQLFWEKVRDRRFLDLKFYRQHPLFVDVSGRETFFIADFYCHERKLVIELDGKIHDYNKQHDKARTEIVNSLGVSVVRFTNQEIEHDVKKVLEKLKKVLK